MSWTSNPPIAAGNTMILLLDNAIRIPLEAAGDFAAFRNWTKSRDFPERGEYAFLGDELWADLSMETLLHNQLKHWITVVVGSLVASGKLGVFFADRMRLVHEGVLLSDEPDAMFASAQAVSEGRVRWEKGRESLEVIGAPDMVLEVVSANSVHKDTVVLRELYAAAGITEYWLVNPLAGKLEFDILRLTRGRYAATRKNAGWIKSAVFDKSFRLVEVPDDHDFPQYELQVR